MTPRGTTLRIRRDPDPSRLKPWGLHWNVYREGFTGRPQTKSKWFATEAEAEQFKAQVLMVLATELTPTVTRSMHRHEHSLAALAVEWLAHVQGQREAATHRSYASLVANYLAPEPGHRRYPGLGNLIISDAMVKPKVIADYLMELHADGVSLSMRRRLHRSLSAFCTYAQFAGRLTGHNPCFNLGRLIRRRGEEDAEAVANPFTPADLAAIFDHLAAVEPDWLAYFQFLYDVGARPGEVAALKWTAVELDRHRARIEASYSPSALDDKLPKTHERRTVDLTAQIVEQLLKWRLEQREEAFRRGRPQPAYVFTSRRLCRMLQGGTARLVFARVMTACRITGHTLYDFRHSFATSHLNEGWDRKLPWVSKQLGHKSPTTTAAYYYAFRDTTATRGFADEIRAWEKG